MPSPGRASNELLSAQLDRAIETSRFLAKLMTELWAILISADALLVVYGLSTKSSIAVLIGAGFMGVAAIATYTIARTLVPVAYVAFAIERRLRLIGEFGLANVVGPVVVKDLYARFVVIAESSGGDDDAVAQTLRPVRARLGTVLTWAFIVAGVVQVGVGLWLWLSMGMPLVSPPAAIPTAIPTPTPTP